MSGLIKICGMRNSESVTIASEAGATAIGFILAPSRRQVTPEDVFAMLSGRAPDRFDSVGVVVNEFPDQLENIRQRSGIDILQLAGDEEPKLLDKVSGRLWKVLRFPSGTTLDSARATVYPWLSHQRPVELVLVDAAVDGAYGGTGHRADWEVASRLAEEFPVVLAGGLNPANVAEAISSVRPHGVDVASGVEEDGQKSPTLIRRFIEASQLAYSIQRELT